jgi:hypothetical protein
MGLVALSLLLFLFPSVFIAVIGSPIFDSRQRSCRQLVLANSEMEIGIAMLINLDAYSSI